MTQPKTDLAYLRNEKAKAEQKLRSCQHRERILERQMSELNRRERVHRLCTRALRELEAARLIERRSNGFSKPNQVFLSFPSTAQKCTVKMVKNEQPDCSKVSNTIAQNCTPNQINKNNLRLNQLSRTKEAYGRYRNVFLEDYSELEMEIAELDTLIEDLSAYMQSTGRKYADHAATLRSWSARKKRQQKPGAGIPDYTYNKEESL